MEYKSKFKQAAFIQLLLFTIMMLSAMSSFAEQRMEMDGTAIIGNKELPKVLYIVPWKSSEPIALSTPEFNSVLDESFQPIDRASFKREIEFHQQLHAIPNKQ